MNRGMVTLTKEELAASLALVPEGENQLLFRQRLEAATQTAEKSTALECSEEDLELLLDLLPAPHENPGSVAEQLRPKLQQTLMQMRSMRGTQSPSLLSRLNPFKWFHK